MRIRIGFISNSSSASFVLHTDFSMQDFKEILLMELSNYFCKENIVIEIHRVIDDNLKYIEAAKKLKTEHEKDLSKALTLTSQLRCDHFIKMLKDVEEDKIDLIDTVLEVFGPYSLNENQMKRASISGSASMFNDENDFGTLLIKIRDMLEEKYGHSSYMTEMI